MAGVRPDVQPGRRQCSLDRGGSGRHFHPVAFVVLALALLSGCENRGEAGRGQRTNGDHAASSADPQNWRGRQAKDCPDLTGRYELSATKVDGGNYDLLSTFLGAGVHHAAGHPWRAVAIEGDTATQLQLKFERLAVPQSKAGNGKSGSLPGLAGSAPGGTSVVDEHVVVLRYGTNYRCKRGWLVAVNPDLSTPSIRRSGAGLEGELIERTQRVIPLWAETGAGIPYWIKDTPYSVFWATAPRLTAATADGVPPRPTERLAQQEWDLTYGSGLGSPPQRKPMSPAGGIGDVQAFLRGFVDRNAEVESIRSEGVRYVVVLRVESRGAVTRTVENLRADPHVQDVVDHGVVSGGSRPDTAMISLRVVASR